MHTEKSILAIANISNAWGKLQSHTGPRRLMSSIGNGNVHIFRTSTLKNLATRPLTLFNNLQCITDDARQNASVGARHVFQQESKTAFGSKVGYKQSNLINFTDRWMQPLPFISGSNAFRSEGIRMSHMLTNRHQANINSVRFESTKPSEEKVVVLSRKDKLKRAVAEYGSTVIVFHVGISLVSLGTCYVLVSSGIDIGQVLVPLGFTGSAASNAGTFVTAYAIHKVFAPVRISITLGATPFIVRYLRRIGFLKKPKPKVE